MSSGRNKIVLIKHISNLKKVLNDRSAGFHYFLLLVKFGFSHGANFWQRKQTGSWELFKLGAEKGRQVLRSI